MDFSNVRKQFVPKKVAYACSYDPQGQCGAGGAVPAAGGLRLIVRSKPNGPPAGEFFHVLDQLSVAGVDERKHNCPVGTIELQDESVLLRDLSAVGTVQGRMRVRTVDDAVIDVTYSGVLKFRVPAVAPFLDDMVLEGYARVVPTFVTVDSRYHWLAEHACAAFGTWKADVPDRQGIRSIASALDVYSLD